MANSAPSSFYLAFHLLLMLPWHWSSLWRWKGFSVLPSAQRESTVPPHECLQAGLLLFHAGASCHQGVLDMILWIVCCCCHLPVPWTFLCDGSTALVGIFSSLKWICHLDFAVWALLILCRSWCSTWLIFIDFSHFWAQSHFPRGTLPVFILVITALLGFEIIKLTTVVSCWWRCWAPCQDAERLFCASLILCSPDFIPFCKHPFQGILGDAVLDGFSGLSGSNLILSFS